MMMMASLEKGDVAVSDYDCGFGFDPLFDRPSYASSLVQFLFVSSPLFVVRHPQLDALIPMVHEGSQHETALEGLVDAMEEERREANEGARDRFVHASSLQLGAESESAENVGAERVNDATCVHVH